MAREPKERKPWDRSKGETRKAYEAFLAYRDLGPSRTLLGAAAALSKSGALMAGWSKKWGWVDRVACYEEFTRAESEHIAFERRVEEQLREQEDRERQRKTRLGGARMMRTVATTVAMELGAALQAGEHRQQVTCQKCGAVVSTDRLSNLIALAGKAALMFNTGANHERLEEKEPTEIVATQVSLSESSLDNILRGFAEIVRDSVAPAHWDEVGEKIDGMLESVLRGEGGNGNL